MEEPTDHDDVLAPPSRCTHPAALPGDGPPEPRAGGGDRRPRPVSRGLLFVSRSELGPLAGDLLDPLEELRDALEQCDRVLLAGRRRHVLVELELRVLLVVRIRPDDLQDHAPRVDLPEKEPVGVLVDFVDVAVPKDPDRELGELATIVGIENRIRGADPDLADDSPAELDLALSPLTY